MTRPRTDTADLSDTALERCGRTDDDTIKQADRVPGSLGGSRPATFGRLVRVESDGTRHYEQGGDVLEHEAVECMNLLATTVARLPDRTVRAALNDAVDAFHLRMAGEHDPFPLTLVLLSMAMLAVGFAAGVVVAGVR